MDLFNAKPTREKYWSEISDSEKVTRLRSEVKKLQKRVEKQTNILAALLVQVREHVHTKEGHAALLLTTTNGEQERYESTTKNVGDDCFF